MIEEPWRWAAQSVNHPTTGSPDEPIARLPDQGPSGLARFGRAPTRRRLQKQSSSPPVGGSTVPGDAVAPPRKINELQEAFGGAKCEVLFTLAVIGQHTSKNDAIKSFQRDTDHTVKSRFQRSGPRPRWHRPRCCAPPAYNFEADPRR